MKIRKYKLSSGVTIIELIISLAIFSFILLVVVSFLVLTNTSNTRSKANREAQENARRVLDKITYEVRNAKNIYTPTTTSNQLSLKTTKYLPFDENYTFIDFFICGADLCLKKESQNPIILNSDSVVISSILFTQIMNGTIPSLQINLVVSYKNPNNNPVSAVVTNLTSTVSLRSN